MPQQSYSYDEAYQSSLEYFNGNDLAAKVFVDKYALKDNEQNLLEKNPTDMHWRLANEFARIEKKKFKQPLSSQQIFDLFDKFKYIVPQGSPMYGIGNDYTVQSLGNCFTLGEHPYDSYGGICYADQMLVQLSKRRCVGKDTKVFIKDGGIVKIQDVASGDQILSFNTQTRQSEFKVITNRWQTEVPSNQRVQIKFSNGSIIRTSTIHPILCIRDDKYQYINAGQLNINDVCIKPNLNIDYLSYNEKLSEIGWFIGCHMGDGTCDLKNAKARFRNLGDNESVIKEYARIANLLSGQKCNYFKSTRKHYKSDVWEFTLSRSKAATKILEKYLDNQHGKKTYSGFIPKFIKDNNLWIPFLAGLVDSDGWIRSEKSIKIAICAKNIIDELSVFLGASGIRYGISIRSPRLDRPNEQTLYCLTIYASDLITAKLQPLLKHSVKKEILNISNREFSYTVPIGKIEQQEIVTNYIAQQYQTNRYNKATTEKRKAKANLNAIIRLLKNCGRIGLGGLKSFLEHGIITQDKLNEILQRVEIVEISQDASTEVYYDLEVEGNNNFYAGDYGLVNIHNCGVGLCLDNIRPKGMVTKNAAKTTDGIAVFMERYSNSLREVAQNGRRGAGLEGLSIHHPEIETFINIKRDLKKVTGANISTLNTDEFMIAVENNQDYEQRWPIDSINPQIKKTVKAKDVWNKIIEGAWLSAEPGVVYIDNTRRFGLSHQYSKIDNRFKDIIPNPCGEIIMGMDSCRLMLLNLFSYVDKPFTKEANFNYALFNNHVQLAQRLMDDMVDLEIEKMEGIIAKVQSDPEPPYIKQLELDMWKNYLETAKLGRRTGLGETGLGDALAALNIKYGSQESIDKTEEIYRNFGIQSMISSCVMAKELGSFPLYDKNIEEGHPFLERLFDVSPELKELHNKHGRRNISLTTTSPAGTVSLLTKTTSGIEPAFLLTYTRRRKISRDAEKYDFIDAMGDKWEDNLIKHHHLDTWSKITGKTNIEESPYWGATSNDVDWLSSVKLQAAAQRWTSHSISKTCNVPKDTSKELISEMYMEAWKQGLKGFTLYREGSRDGVLISNTEKKDEKRPKELECSVHHIKVKGKEYFVLVGLKDGTPYEVFAGKNGFLDKKVKHGKIIKVRKHYKAIFDDGSELVPITATTDEFEEAITRLTSVSLRCGASIESIVDQLEKVDGDMTSFARSVARALKHYIPDGEVKDEKCEECSGQIMREEGCKKCVSCGWSKCS